MRRRHILLAISVLVLVFVLVIQNGMKNVPSPDEVVESEPLNVPILSQNDLERHMNKLTSADLDGRYPGTEGNRLAASYIREQMVAIGLKSPTFADDHYMMFSALIPIKLQKTTMMLNDGEESHVFEFGRDYVEFVTRNFAMGNGAHSGTYQIIDDPDKLYAFDGSSIVVYTKSAIEGISYDELFGKIILSSDRPKMVLYESNQQNSGYFVLSPYSRFVEKNDNQSGILIYKVSEGVIVKLKNSPEGTLSANTAVSLSSEEIHNIIGMIDGTGETGYAITAHFDHLGNNLDGTFNPGALDNASGIATMLVLAEALMEVGNPELDYYFVAFNAEEEGLYGSEAFVQHMPLDVEGFSFINIDMVGSSLGIPVTVSATQSQSHMLQASIVELAKDHGVETILSDSGSSDHVPLEYVGYKAISLTELDKRYYHTPEDTIEQSIDYGRMVQLAGWILSFVEK